MVKKEITEIFHSDELSQEDKTYIFFWLLEHADDTDLMDMINAVTFPYSSASEAWLSQWVLADIRERRENPHEFTLAYNVSIPPHLRAPLWNENEAEPEQNNLR